MILYYICNTRDIIQSSTKSWLNISSVMAVIWTWSLASPQHYVIMSSHIAVIWTCSPANPRLCPVAQEKLQIHINASHKIEIT